MANKKTLYDRINELPIELVDIIDKHYRLWHKQQVICQLEMCRFVKPSLPIKYYDTNKSNVRVNKTNGRYIKDDNILHLSKYSENMYNKLIQAINKDGCNFETIKKLSIPLYEKPLIYYHIHGRKHPKFMFISNDSYVNYDIIITHAIHNIVHDDLTMHRQHDDLRVTLMYNWIDRYYLPAIICIGGNLRTIPPQYMYIFEQIDSLIGNYYNSDSHIEIIKTFNLDTIDNITNNQYIELCNNLCNYVKTIKYQEPPSLSPYWRRVRGKKQIYPL